MEPIDVRERLWGFMPYIVPIVFLGLQLRFLAVGTDPFWNDEAITLWYIRQHNPVELFYQIPLNQPHPPLYYMILDLWTAIVGFDEPWVRAPSIIFGTGTIYFSYRIGEHLFDEPTALLTALLIAVGPFFIRISQSARMYALVGMLTAASYFAYLSLLNDHGEGRTSLYIVSTMGLLLSHVYGLYVVITQVLYVCWRINRDRTQGWSAHHYPFKFLVPVVVLALLVGIVLFVKILVLPNVLGQFMNTQVSTAYQVMIAPGPEFSPLDVFFWTFTEAAPKGGFLIYTDGPVEGLASPIQRLLSDGSHILSFLSITLVIGTFVYTEEWSRSPARLTVIWLSLPLLFVVVTGLLGIQYRPRYAVVAAIPFFILLSRSIIVVPRERLQAGFAIIIIALLLSQTFAVYQTQDGIDYDEAATHIDSRANADDITLVLYHQGASSFEKKPSGFYFREKPYAVHGVSIEENALDRLTQLIKGEEETLWIVTPLRFSDTADQMSRQLHKKGYTVRTRFSTDTVAVYRFTRVSGASNRDKEY